ncbi:MAG: DUF937 domain-containing protein, partial [Actinobacteria bacterium]|nr:DUF937 domain-containing protein [Actinomycetota bacterium]
VDAEDGAKIVHHIFGDQSTQLAHALGQRTGTDGSLVSRLLHVLAPVVLAYAGKKLGLATPAGGGGVLGDFLGSILAGTAATESDTSETRLDSGTASGTGLDSGTASETGLDSGTSSDSGAGSGTSSESGLTTGASSDRAPVEEPSSDSAPVAAEQRPQSGGSIVDEILGGLFGKR